jgi:hypothetical protein
MLFLQGTRDNFADSALIKKTCSGLGKRARLVTFAEADHSFHVPKSSGSTDAETLGAMIGATADWMDELIGLPRRAQ